MSELYELLKSCEANGLGTVRDSYSGRGMFGERCIGIDTDDPDYVREKTAKAGFGLGCIDNMGLGYIVYWPGAKE